MEFNFQSVTTEQPKKLFSTDFTVQSTVSDAESGGVKKILSVSAEPRISNTEIADGGVRISGRVNFKLFYVDADGALKNLDYFNDFTHFVPTESVATDRLTSVVACVETTAKTDLTVRVGARIAIDVYASESASVEALITAPDNVYSEYECGRTARFSAESKHSATFEDEQETRSPVDGIMTYENAVVLTDVKAGDGSFKATGKIVSTVCYLSAGDIKKIQFDLPFDEECFGSSVTAEQSVFGTAELKSARIVLGGDDKNTSIKTEVSVDFTFWTYLSDEVKYVKDLYSAKIELTPEYCPLSAGRVLAVERFDQKISGSVTLSDDYAPIRQTVEVLGVRNNVASVDVIKPSSDKNGSVKYRIEGIMLANVVYIDENGLNSVAAEIPYSDTFDGRFGGNVSPVLCTGIAENAFARVKGDRKIEVSADLIFAVQSIESDTLNLICKVAEGEEKPQNESAFSVYVAADGDGVWEVAKAMSARPDEITTQNPELVFPLKSGDRAVIYRKLESDI